MFEDKTYEAILDRILKRLPEDMDPGPSTPLYILSGPAAMEISKLYEDLDYTIEQVFPTTQDREHLIRDAETYKVAPYDAKPSIAEGEFDIEVALGTRFSREQMNFTVTEYIGPRGDYHYYRMRCETPGQAGNVAPGKMIPIWNIQNLTHAYLTRILIPGEEEEPTEDFRARYLDYFRHPRYGGNLADYINEVCAFDGVGRCKILRCRDFEGKVNLGWVGIVITDAAGNKPTDELVNDLQEHIQPLGVSGLPEIETSGLGVAPINHRAFVRGVRERVIDLKLALTFEAGSSWTALKDAVTKRVTEYLKSLALSWGDIITTEKAKFPLDDHLIVRRASVETEIMDLSGIIDVQGVSLNGKYRNLELDWDEIPVLGEITQIDPSELEEDGKCPFDCPDCDCDPAECPRLGG